jgi:hypothetical protein
VSCDEALADVDDECGPWCCHWDVTRHLAASATPATKEPLEMQPAWPSSRASRSQRVIPAALTCFEISGGEQPQAVAVEIIA